MALPALKNLHPPDNVAARDAVDDRQSADDLPEDGVTALQMRLRGVCDEKLAAAGVLARKSHPDRAASVRSGVDLATAKGIALVSEDSSRFRKLAAGKFGGPHISISPSSIKGPSAR